jgi:hypothetical protein
VSNEHIKLQITQFIGIEAFVDMDPSQDPPGLTPIKENRNDTAGMSLTPAPAPR